MLQEKTQDHPVFVGNEKEWQTSTEKRSRYVWMSPCSPSCLDKFRSIEKYYIFVSNLGYNVYLVSNLVVLKTTVVFFYVNLKGFAKI